ncbi:16S rRNA pseudouridine(516) synthase RsuA [Moritella sp.]|uniref:16S rRNA pseudouridine(516) synthase RsuA n=1 Tax=Moritella sp. TaxID=78556 RepID=UPI001D5C592B|nr:16S rRNA pseudouridine(516) synthase RsuA [Moritella sp.]MCJ8349036.1 16S rRNA pseudouridine(516) synthase RsuA [Moritella sp.]NQZ41411.1 16S rRNA pseudouridine(516) synthase RsuA [Moritella sp.]
MRLDKFICQSTNLTRTLAKREIARSNVKINGEVVRKADHKVTADMDVWFSGRSLSQRPPRYIMMHKPLDVICSTVDEEHPSVMNLIEADKREELHIAGRLDVDTTGLVLITDDGKWSHRVTSPKRACNKRYRVQLAEAIAPTAVADFAAGIHLRSEDKPCLPAKLEILSEKEVLLTIQEGKYHQVKRMFASQGNSVVGLHREQIGDIVLDPALELGEWRYLTDEEASSI